MQDAFGSALTAMVRRGGVASLFPDRLAGAVSVTGTPVLRDVLPVGDDGRLAVFETEDEYVAAPVVAAADTVRRARPGDGVFDAILDTIADAAPHARFAAHVFGDVPPVRGERPIDVDQSNDSVRVGDAVVKLYPRMRPGPQPGMDVPAHLAAVGFGETPAPLGALTWRADDGQPVLLATASAFLPEAVDGWTWFVDLVVGTLDGAVATEDALAPAGALGGLVARLHLALATPSAVFPSPVSTAAAATVQGWRRAALAVLDQAVAATDGPEGERLAALASDAGAALEQIADVDATPTMRIHGDLHVGQILRSRGRYAVSDFDGNPLATREARTALDAPARDVASMARAIDHVGRIAQRRHPGRDADVAAWIAEARARFIATYEEQLGARREELYDVRLLRPFEVAQECHEFLYAARYLPRWRYVPDLAMPALLGVTP
jgi:maltokinase